MDDPNQPPGDLPPTAQTPGWPPPAYPPAGAPPPGYLPPGTPPPGYPQPWAVPPEPIGPAPGILFAPHGARLVAYLVDGILLGVLVLAVTISLTLLTAGLATAGAGPLALLSGLLLVVAIFTVSLGYFPWFWVNGGATPGMRIFHLRLVRDRDGGPIGWGEASIRLIGMWISASVFYLGYIWIFIDKRHRGWQDLIAGTLMVQTA
jgi:uncharacterized RDD family membrane protein YckC